MLSEFQKGLLYNLSIMEDTGTLENAPVSEVANFCHILTDDEYQELQGLRKDGYITYYENKRRFRNFHLTAAGRKEGKNFLLKKQ